MEGNYDKYRKILDKEILKYYKLQTWGKHCKCRDEVIKNTKNSRNSIALFCAQAIPSQGIL